MRDNKVELRSVGKFRRRLLATGVAVVDVPINQMPCRLVYPRFTLPELARYQGMATVELPAADVRNAQSTSESTLISSDGHAETIQLGVGLIRPSNRTNEENDDEEIGEILPADRIAQLVSFHVERCNEIMFPPTPRSRNRRRRLRGITRTGWDKAREIYWRGDDDNGPLRLIVRIAQECGQLLGEVCNQPRRILRRIRRPTRLERVQQIDDACMRWLARQPGRTWVEKSGPQRRVLAVERIETADTPENRVVRDFLERIVRECTAYLKEHQTKKKTSRYRSVQRFRTSSIRWMRETELGSVPRIVGKPAANYVLQFDMRYARIWHWYERLRRQQSAADDAWLWRRRVLVEHLRFAFADAFSHERCRGDFLKRLYLNAEIDRGWFVDPNSLLGPWRTRDHGLRYLITSEEIFDASKENVAMRWMAKYGADLVITHLGTSSSVLIFIQFNVGADRSSHREDSAELLAQMLDSDRRVETCRILVLNMDATRACSEFSIRTSGKTTSGRNFATINAPWPGENSNTNALNETLVAANLL